MILWMDLVYNQECSGTDCEFFEHLLIVYRHHLKKIVILVAIAVVIFTAWQFMGPLPKLMLLLGIILG